MIAESNDNPDLPLGDQSDTLQAWLFSGEEMSETNSFFKPSSIDKDVFDPAAQETGAMVVGRRTHDIVGGWGGSHPLENIPVFVLTHHIPDSPPKGSTPLTFVIEGAEQFLRKKITWPLLMHWSNGHVVRFTPHFSRLLYVIL